VSAFQPARALAFALSISRPRLSGTDGERRVGGEVRAALEAAGLEVAEEAFDFRPSADGLARLSLLTAQIGLAAIGLGAWLDPRWAWGGIAWVALIVLFRNRVFRALASARCRAAGPGAPPSGWVRAANIVGRATGPAEGPLLIFLAHHDSKSQSLSLGAAIGLLRWTRTASFAFAGAALARAGGWDVPLPLLAAGAVAVLALSVPLYLLRTGNRSPGALDNASGVGALVEMARGWGRIEGSPRCRAIFLSPAAEEFGMVGSEVWVRTHAAALRAEPRVWALNFDGVGLGGPVRVVPAAGPERGGLSMPRLLRDAGDAVGLALAPVPPSVGLVTDHVSFTREGIPCATLLTHSWTARRIHTERDAPEGLQEEGFANVGRIAEQFVRRVSGAGAATPPSRPAVRP